MTAFCTYCSAEKNDSADLLPAVERYRNARIGDIHASAQSAGLPFFVLSGKFGLVRPQDPLPYYDHLLGRSEVPQLAAKVSEQLCAFGVDQIVFFTRPVSDDRNVEPYIDCMTAAADRAGAAIMIVTLPLRQDV